MKITVLNGSPKGNTSVTMQYVHYLQQQFPDHEMKILNVCQRVRQIEADPQVFDGILDDVKSSDAILWAFPLYYMLVAANYKRFIELIGERKASDAFQGKYSAALATSIHFFDHTAINYLHAVSEDLGMKFAGWYSADMYDLLRETERKRLDQFAESFFDTAGRKLPVPRSYADISPRTFTYQPKEATGKLEVLDKKILILTDAKDPQSNQAKMVERFRSCLPPQAEVVNLRELNIKGACLGCIQCGWDNRCIYDGQDEFTDFYRNKVQAADIIVLAGSIQDRYLSSVWKTFFDRSFFNGHVPSMAGKQIAVLISGPLSQVPNLGQIVQAYAELQRANLVGVVTDEFEDSENLDGLIQDLAERTIRFALNGYVRTRTFLSIGGAKLFRDEIFGRLRFPFRADHKFYQDRGMYDFPQSHYRTRLLNKFMLLLTKIPSIRKEIYTKRIKTEMIKPLSKFLRR